MILGSHLGSHWRPRWAHRGPRRAPDATKASKMLSQGRSQKKIPKNIPKSMDFGTLSDPENRALPCAALKFSLFGRAPPKSPKSILFGIPFWRVLGQECSTVPSQGGIPRAPSLPTLFRTPSWGPQNSRKDPQKGCIPEGPSPKLVVFLPLSDSPPLNFP